MKKLFLILLFALQILRGQLFAQTCDSMRLTVQQQPRVSCTDTLRLFKLTVIGGKPPYTFNINNGAATTNPIVFLPRDSNYITVTDSMGCRRANIFTYIQRSPLDTVVTTHAFVPNSACDTLGTLSLFVDRALQRPLRISFNGGITFTTDTVFRNIEINDYQYFIIKTAQGCIYKSNFIIPTPTPLELTIQAQPRLHCTDSIVLYKLRVSGGQPPYIFNINNGASTTDSILFLPLGYNSFRITDANCRKTTILRYIEYQHLDTVATRYTFVPNNICDTIGTLTLKVDPTLQRPLRISLNDGITYTTDTVFRNMIVYDYLFFLVKTPQGCTYQGRINHTDSVYLYPKPFEIYAEQQRQQNCTDSLRAFKINVLGGRAPYIFNINGGANTTNTVAHLRQGLNYISVMDAQGCRAQNLYTYITYRQDSLETRATFVPNINCGNMGTLTVSTLSPNLTRPLSISLDGRAFTTDSVFQNINFGNGSLPIRIQSVEGCFYNQIKYTSPTFTLLRYKLNYNSCGTAAPLSISYDTIMGVTYSFRLNGVASATNTWQNILPGRYTIGYTSSNGCNSQDSTVYLIAHALEISAEQQPLVQSCTDSLRPFKISVFGGQAPYSFNIDGGARTTNAIAFFSKGFHYVSVEDATGCRTENLRIQIIHNNRDTGILVQSRYVPTGRCDRTGTLTIYGIDPRLGRPLSISFNNSPFTTDSVFQNVLQHDSPNQYYPIKIRTPQGCLDSSQVNTFINRKLEVSSVIDSCANRLGYGNIWVNATGGIPPLTYVWSNGALSQTLTNARMGTYTVFIRDANGCEIQKTVTLTTCVWAGDTDTSGVVNAADLLNIGLAYGERGQPRNSICTNDSAYYRAYCATWQPNKTPFWSKQTPLNVNFKHIDADGNGVIDNRDTLPIMLNWNKTRNFRNDNVVQIRAAAPPILVQTGRVIQEQWTTFPIILGDATNVANGIYGLAFTINYDPSVIDASSVYLTFEQNWLGNNDAVLKIFKNFDGSIEAAITRINQQNSTGTGQIATLHFKTKTGMARRNLVFSINNQQVINRDAQAVPTVAPTTSTTVLTATSELGWAHQISVYPNPTTGKVIVEGQNMAIKSVEVFDISGKSLFKTENIGQDTPLSINNAGTYFLKIQTEKGVLMRKIVRL